MIIAATIIGLITVSATTIYGLRRYKLSIPSNALHNSGEVFMVGAPGGILGWIAITFLWQLANKLVGNVLTYMHPLIGIIVFIVVGIVLGFFFAATQIDPIKAAKALLDVNIIEADQERKCAQLIDFKMTRFTFWWNLSLGILWLLWFLVVSPGLPQKWFFSTPLPALVVCSLVVLLFKRFALGNRKSLAYSELDQAISAAAKHAADTPEGYSIVTGSNVIEILLPGSTSSLLGSRYKVLCYDKNKNTTDNN